MPKNAFVFLIVAVTALLASPLHGFAQMIAPDNYPLHIVVENLKAGPENPVASMNNDRAVISYEGTIKEIYKNDASVRNYMAITVRDQIKFNISCYPPTPPNAPISPSCGDCLSLECESIKNASNIEIWAFPNNGGPLSVNDAKLK